MRELSSIQLLHSFALIPECIKLARSFEATRKKWLHAELELKKYKELLVKSDVEKISLEVKLKHARNQVDVEIKRRFKAEGDYQYLVSLTEIITADFLISLTITYAAPM